MKNTARRPKITVSADGRGLVSQAGALLLAEAARVTGLGEGLSAGLARWRAPRAVHDPGKIIADLAVALALGGDCLADVAVLRCPAGAVRAGGLRPGGLPADHARWPRTRRGRCGRSARRGPRPGSGPGRWPATGRPGADGALIPVDIDATIVIAHSEKEQAAPTWKKTFGHHPLTAFADHGAGGGRGTAGASCCGPATPDPTPPPSTSR